MGGQRQLGWVLGAVASALACAPVAGAATIVVDDGGDSSDAKGCTLRKAVRAANADAARGACRAGSGADTIQLGVDTVTLRVPGAQEDDGATGDLDVKTAITLAGRSPGGTTVDAAGIDRVLDVRPGGVVEVRDATLTGGVAPAGADGAAGSSNTGGRGGYG